MRHNVCLLFIINRLSPIPPGSRISALFFFLLGTKSYLRTQSSEGKLTRHPGISLSHYHNSNPPGVYAFVIPKEKLHKSISGKRDRSKDLQGCWEPLCLVIAQFILYVSNTIYGHFCWTLISSCSHIHLRTVVAMTLVGKVRHSKLEYLSPAVLFCATSVTLFNTQRSNVISKTLRDFLGNNFHQDLWEYGLYKEQKCRKRTNLRKYCAFTYSKLHGL